MFDKVSLNIKGKYNQPVPNTYFRQRKETEKISIILPGYNPPLINPILYYTNQLVLSRNSDLLQIEYEYYKTDFLKKPELEREKWLATDVSNACEAVITQRDYRHITLIGKSLGTVAMGYLLNDIRFQNAVCIWLTPLLTNKLLCIHVKQFKPRSLFVIGTADPFYNAGNLSDLVTTTHGKSIVIDGATHSLDVQGDITKTLAALTRVVTEIGEFIS